MKIKFPLKLIISFKFKRSLKYHFGKIEKLYNSKIYYDAWELLFKCKIVGVILKEDILKQ